MRRTFPMTLRLTAILTLAMSGVMLADVYDHSGTAGDFQDGKWLNQTTTPPGGPNVYGNPGPGDDAYFFGSTITASGGGVHLLSGDKLQLSGTLTAVNVGILSLSGSGTLSVQAVVTDKYGFTGVTITGGHLKAQNGQEVGSVTAGGTVMDVTCTGQCGLYDGGSSLTITGLGSSGHANFFNASTLTASGGLQDFFLNFQSGSTGNVSTINRGSATVNGSGSNLTVAGDFLLNSSLMASSGGVVTVNGKLNSGFPVYATGSGSTINVGQDFSITGGDLQINTGGAVRVGTLTQNRGSDSLDGGNSTLTVDQDFSLMAGFLDISAGGTLTVNGQLVLDGGKDRDGNTISGGGIGKGKGRRSAPPRKWISATPAAGAFPSPSATVRRCGPGLLSSGAGSAGYRHGRSLWGRQRFGRCKSGGNVGGRKWHGIWKHNGTGAHLLLGDGTAFAVGFNSVPTAAQTRMALAPCSMPRRQKPHRRRTGQRWQPGIDEWRLVTFGQNAFIGNALRGSLSLRSGSRVSVTGGSNTQLRCGRREGFFRQHFRSGWE